MWSVQYSMMSSRYLIFYLAILFMNISYGAVLPQQRMATNIEGPSSQSRIVGPDGSVIMADNPGGRIIHQETLGVFEPVGRFVDSIFQGPQLLNPTASGQLAHKAIDAAILGPSIGAAQDTHSIDHGTEIGAVYAADKSTVDVEAH
ncbi:uncharacterized protein LOC109540630 isoform X1 [Dendroctonus ponderosae]|uniref:uncharacterized protein LOC109540630 isoform X1 n=1 Tax=Dendroctonus ponderosae TaxID=77166 RepID=UPI002035EF10|nr:uncharacterized protein LOC109540630 isoform X1 [Dendroctonus ponderosae]